MLSASLFRRFQIVLIMLCYWSLFLYFLLQFLESSSSLYPEFNFNLNSKLTDKNIQENASLALIGRILPPDLSKKFKVDIDQNSLEDYAHLESSESGDCIKIKASSGVMATWIFNEFLRKYANSHISWDHKQLNSSLPKGMNFTLKPSDLVRFYQNPCLYGYSFAFWKWPDWSNHLDWIALNGFNLVLAPSGQELIWLKTYQSLGLKNLTGFFTGQAFLPWNRMGNLKAWSGPLSHEDMHQDIQLQHQILAKLQSFGIRPVIPAFNGIVPTELLPLFPHETFHPLRTWGHFTSKYSGLHYLMPDSSLFKLIQKRFHDFYIQEYGSVSSFYSFDTFNEMSPPSEDLNFLAAYGKNVIANLRELDSNAIWVMQGWLFKNQTFWTYERSKALLTSLDPQHMLILDLASTTNPQFQRLDSYFGRPFVYCMIHNYGGTNGMYGKASTVNLGPHETRNKYQSMVGIGVTPEGIHNSYVMYELLMEAFSRQEPIDDLNEWFAKYSHRRYGLQSESLEKSWMILGHSVYNCCSALPSLPKPFRYHGKTTFTVLPRVSHVRIGYPKWYKVHHLLEAWTLLLNASNIGFAASEKEIYQYDLIEVTRDSLEVMLDQQYLNIMAAYFTNDSHTFDAQTQIFMQLLQDMEKVLATNKHFMLGPWLEKAKAFGADQHRSNV